MDDFNLVDKVVLDYLLVGKCMLWDNGFWIGIFKKDNVYFVIDKVVEIMVNGVKFENGNDIEVEVIIYGIGFYVNWFLWFMIIIGWDGVNFCIEDVDDFYVYFGIIVLNFFNLFFLYGLNINIVVNGFIIFFFECEMCYIIGCFKFMFEEGYCDMECKLDVCLDFIVEVDVGNVKMVWG